MYKNLSHILSSLSFNLELVSGITQSEKGNYLDFLVDKPEGMSGYMLQLTTYGCGKVFDGKQFVYAKKGQLLLFSPFVQHYYHRHENSQYWHYKWIYFQPSLKWAKWLNWTNIKQDIGRIFIEDSRYFLEISQLFSKIEMELKSNHFAKEDLVSGLLEYLLMKCISIEKFNDIPVIDNRVLEICEFILANLSKNISIETLSGKVYLSSSRLSHLFKSSLGVSIIKWRENQRISEAKKLLHFSNISISNLAKLLGYEDALYFSKIFKKHTGLSPSDFRISGK